MNATLVLALLRQRLTTPFRVIFLLFFFGFPLLLISFVPGASLSLLGGGYAFALVFSVGAIGQDVSAGVLQLLLARPVRRSEYVLSRWLAAGAGAAGLALVQAALGAGFLLARGIAPSANDVLGSTASSVLEAFGVSAVVILFSALVPGVADLGLYFLMLLVSQIAGGAGEFVRRPMLVRASEEIQRFIHPQIGVIGMLAGSISWFEIASYLSTVTLCLALAIVAMNRKELSYATG